MCYYEFTEFYNFYIGGKEMKKVLALVLSFVMVFSVTTVSLPVDAAAKNTVKTSITKVESKAKGFKVTWKKKSKIKGYQIQYSTSSKFKKSSTKSKTISKAKTKSATISKLKGCNKKYYVRVRTYKTSKGKKIYSSWSKTKKVTTLKHKYSKATCTKAKTCKYCKKTSGKALGHLWSNWTVVVDATVRRKGLKERACYRCEEFETSSIPKLQESNTVGQEDTTKKWFLSLYNLSVTQYKNSFEQSKKSKQDELADYKTKIDDELEKYIEERSRILNRYPNTATREVMLTNAQQNYAAAIKPYKNRISEIEAEIAEIDEELESPNIDNILLIMAQNGNVSSFEIYKYYDKYSDSIV